MKKVYAVLFLMLATFFCTPVFAQTQGLTYPSFWQRYENFNKAKVKDAHKMLDTIEQKATADHNGLQLFRTHFERAILMSQYAEENSKTTILYLDSMRKKSLSPYTGLYDFLLSEMLNNYFNNNIGNNNAQQTDLHTLDEWSMEEIQNGARRYLESAIQLIDTSYLIDISDFSFMLQQNLRDRYLRPTLLDVMIQTLMSHISFFYETDTLIQADYNKLFDLALKMHRSPSERNIAIDYELVRLEMMRPPKGWDENPDSSAFWNQLLLLEKKYGSDAAFNLEKGIYLYSIAVYRNEHREPSPYFEQSLGYFQKIKDSDDSLLYNNAQYYIEDIRKPYISSEASIEGYMPSAKLLFPITYKSIDTLYVTIYKTTRYLPLYFRHQISDKYPYEHLTGKDFDRLNTFVSQTMIVLPPTYKFNTFTTDLFLDSLPTGNYALLFHTKKNVDTTNVIMYKPIRVTKVKLSCWGYNRYRVFAADRKTGEPLAHRTAIVHRQLFTMVHRYRYGEESFGPEVAFLHLSDRKGMFKAVNGNVDFHYNSQDCYRDISLPYSWHNTGYYYRGHRRITLNESRENTVIVTDRTLYRPGQTIYYKVLAAKGCKVLAVMPVQVLLRDQNDQIVDSITLTTNEFGSVAGQFNITDKMFGRCSLSVLGVQSPKRSFKNHAVSIRGYQNITVADYKRPTFEIDFDRIKEEVKAGDTLNIRGHVTSFAGVQLDGATVTLHITGDSTYTAQTFCDAQGKFVYPCLTRAKSYSYSMSVTATVTDINGETHEKDKSFFIEKKSLFLDIAGCEAINLSILDSIKWIIQARNYEHLALPTKVTVCIEQLKQPAQYQEYLYDMSGTSAPTAPLYDTTAYLKYFPEYTLCKSTQDKSTWSILRKNFEIERSFAPDSLLTVNIKNWPTGSYRATISALDKSGKLEKEIRYFIIFDTDSTKSNRFNPLYINVSDNVKYGEKLPITVGSYLHNANVICEVFQGNHKIFSQIIKLDQSQKTFFVKTIKNKLQTISINAHTVQNDFTYNTKKEITLKYISRTIYPENKTLDINLVHWNKVSEPGSHEHWQVQIMRKDSTPYNEAEMIAWMYDYSLNALGMSTPQWIQPINPERKINISKTFHYFPSYYYQFNMLQAQNYGAISQQISYKYALQNRQYEMLDISKLTRNHSWMRTYLWGTQDITQNDMAVIKYEAPQFNRDRTTYTNSKSVQLASLEGVSSNDAAETAVRGNRSDGVQTITDGVRVRTNEVKVTITRDADPEPANVGQGAGENPSASTESFRFDPNIYMRSDFKETAFFYPQLHTDAQGNITFDFTIPDQYTKWQFMAFAHSKDMHTGELTTFIQTRKSLMIQTNCPRFVREGDTMQFQIKVSNLCDTALNGKVKIQLFNYLTDEPLALLTIAKDSMQSFHSAPKGSTSAAWEVIIPKGLEILGYRVLAQSGHYTDGEENALPVLTNRALMTESMHFAVPGNTDTTYIFKKLQNHKSQTLDSYSYTMEVTANPAWYAVQALPYLMQYRYECNEQLFSKLYANSLAQYILKSNPSIEEMYAKWAADSTHNTLESPLTKNEELHNILLEETPWFYASQRESAQRQQVAKLFDNKTLNSEITKIYNKLKYNQNSDGSWGWFGSNTYSQFITQYIATGYRKLQHIGVNIPDADKMMDKAFRNMDSVQLRRYNAFMADTNPHKRFYIDELDIQYLYAHSFKNLDSAWLAQPYVQFYLLHAVKNIYDANYTRQAEVALILFRIGQTEKAKDIMEAIRQQAFTKQDQGMYWSKDSYPILYCRYYPWYEAPIERQALLIEAFTEIMHNDKEIDQMKQWLLMQKQGQYWSNTKATTEAIYALLLTGKDSNWLTDNNMTISVGSDSFEPAKDTTAEAGTGYLKHVWKTSDVTSDLAKVAIHTDQNHPAFGACYWQYFEDMDKITAASDGLYIRRELYREIPNKNGNGTVLDSITANKPVHIGDKITVRMVIKSDRDLEFVQIKDLRAPTFEPVDYREQYVWCGGLSYYTCPRDASTNFFISYMPKGTHIIEYQLIANQKGQFSNGVATIECMYAPEFRAQSEGFRVTVK